VHGRTPAQAERALLVVEGVRTPRTRALLSSSCGVGGGGSGGSGSGSGIGFSRAAHRTAAEAARQGRRFVCGELVGRACDDVTGVCVAGVIE